MKETQCKDCGDSFAQFRTTQTRCDNCAYTHTKTNSKRHVRKMLNHRGKVTKQWLEVDRPKWIKNHPPSHEGYWECYLGLTKKCRRWLTVGTLTLDHVKARSRDPGKRHRQQNLKPACRNCNNLKGSLSIAQVKKRYPMSKIALGVESSYGF